MKHGRRVVATKEQREQREAAAQSLDEEKKTLVASAFAVYTAIATAFFSSLISFLEPCPLGAIATTCYRTLACRSVTTMSRKDRSEKSCVPSLLWAIIFVGAS